MKALLRELQRRNVWRAALLYIGAVWALAQGIAQLAPELGMPDWSTRAFVIASAVGFPLWLLFAWCYELTPEGLKRESEVAEEESITRQTGRKLDYWIIGVLAVAVVLLLTDRLLTRDTPTADTTAVVADANSVAVLPLANASGDADEDYFSDGLTEELISGLTRIDALRVIGRSSAFEFKGSKDPRSAIARKLGVAHLLEGNVRRSGDQVRIMLELIRPADGTSLWSQTYSREMKDIFAVQADIARSVATALQVRLGGAESVDYEQPPNANLAAYQAVLQGHNQRLQGTEAGMARAAGFYRDAVQLEPDYAAAHAYLALSLLNLANLRSGTVAAPQLQREARAAAGRAMTLAPGYHGSHRMQGYVLQQIDGDLDAAGAAFERAHALAPNDGAAASALAGYFMQRGRLDEAIALMKAAILRDPLRVDWRTKLTAALERAGRIEESIDAARSALAIAPDRADVLVQLSFSLLQAGQHDEAVRHARKAVALEPGQMAYRSNLAWALEGDGQVEEAWATFAEALAVEPDNDETHGQMAAMLLLQGHAADAADHARHAIAANPLNLYWPQIHAVALSSLGELDAAERTLRDAIRNNPEHPYLHATLASVAALRGDVATARTSASAETDPDSRRGAQALVLVLADDAAAAEAAIKGVIADCSGQRARCLAQAAALHAFAGQPDRMFATLAEAEKEPAYRPDLGDPFVMPYWHDPRFLAHLEKYGLSLPSPVSRPSGQAR